MSQNVSVSFKQERLCSLLKARACLAGPAVGGIRQVTEVLGPQFTLVMSKEKLNTIVGTCLHASFFLLDSATVGGRGRGPLWLV